jgi:DNA-binding transcriptional LysR family regulator
MSTRVDSPLGPAGFDIERGLAPAALRVQTEAHGVGEGPCRVIPTDTLVASPFHYLEEGTTVRVGRGSEPERMLMNLNQLRVFYEAARLQSFTQAARSLCVTQPAVTAQVRSLEENLELPLFNKRGPGRRMVLTGAGELLLEHARRIFELEAEMVRALAETRQLKRGLLRISTTKTYARYVMPQYVSRFREFHPGIQVNLDEGSSAEVCKALLEGRSELGVLAASQQIKGLTFVPFREEEVCLFAAPGSVLARRREKTAVGDLAGQPLIMREEGSTLCELVLQFFDRHGVTPRVVIQTSNSDCVKAMVEQGEGAAFLVRSVIEKEVVEGRLAVVPLVDEPLTLQVHIAYLEGGDLSPAALAFLGLLEEEANGPRAWGEASAVSA